MFEIGRHCRILPCTVRLTSMVSTMMSQEALRQPSLQHTIWYTAKIIGIQYTVHIVQLLVWARTLYTTICTDVIRVIVCFSIQKNGCRSHSDCIQGSKYALQLQTTSYCAVHYLVLLGNAPTISMVQRNGTIYPACNFGCKRPPYRKMSSERCSISNLATYCFLKSKVHKIFTGPSQDLWCKIYVWANVTKNWKAKCRNQNARHAQVLRCCWTAPLQTIFQPSANFFSS